jgi:hypothetical protein
VDRRCGGNLRALPENYPHIKPRPQKLPKNLSLGSLVISVAKRRSGLKITVEITRVIGPGGFHLIFCIRARP